MSGPPAADSSASKLLLLHHFLPLLICPPCSWTDAREALHLGAQQHVVKHMVPRKALGVPTWKLQTQLSRNLHPISQAQGPGVSSLENYVALQEKALISLTVIAKSKYHL